jgi:F-type H+-transporting ATPase subunit epsilon
MAELTLEVVTPEKRILSETADEVIVPGFHGLFGVRPGHAPLLSLMEPGVLTFRRGGTAQNYFVSGGFVWVAENKVLVLADSAEEVSEIDVAAAEKRREQAEQKLKGMSVDDVQFERESATVRTEAARMAAATRR